MLRFIFPIFIAIDLQTSFYANAADNTLSEGEISPPTDTKKNLKEKEGLANSLEDIPSCSDLVYDNPEKVTIIYDPIISSPNPTIKELRKAASAYTFALKIEKACQTRVQIVLHPRATLDDWVDLLLSLTFPVVTYPHSPSHLDAHRNIIIYACQLLENNNKIKGNSITRFEIKRSIYNAKKWLTCSLSISH